MMALLVLLQIQLAILCFWSWRGIEGKEIGKGQRRTFIKTNDGPHRGTRRAHSGLHRLCSHYTPQPQSNKYAFNRRLKRDCPLNAMKGCTMFHTWGTIKVNCYTDWQRVGVKDAQQEQYSVCWIKLHRNSSSRLKKYHGFWGHVPPVPLWIRPWFLIYVAPFRNAAEWHGT